MCRRARALRAHSWPAPRKKAAALAGSGQKTRQKAGETDHPTWPQHAPKSSSGKQNISAAMLFCRARAIESRFRRSGIAQ
jgi:hypothetical protein